MRALTLLLLVVGLNATAATVYRSVDADGNVRYTDRPEGNNVEQVVIRTQRGSSPAARPSVAAQRQAAANRAPDDPNAEIQADDGPTEEELREQKENNCKVAKERLERYVTSRRLYREKPDGEREYLNDNELTDARQRAADDVEKWCN